MSSLNFYKKFILTRRKKLSSFLQSLSGCFTK
nr:MAG TPA: hypothetical protein [Caudoviricetes sp.]